MSLSDLGIFSGSAITSQSGHPSTMDHQDETQIHLLTVLTSVFGVTLGSLLFFILYLCFHFRVPLAAFVTHYFGIGRPSNHQVRVEMLCRVRLDHTVIASVTLGHAEDNIELQTESIVQETSDTHSSQTDTFYDCV